MSERGSESAVHGAGAALWSGSSCAPVRPTRAEQALHTTSAPARCATRCASTAGELTGHTRTGQGVRWTPAAPCELFRRPAHWPESSQVTRPVASELLGSMARPKSSWVDLRIDPRAHRIESSSDVTHVYHYRGIPGVAAWRSSLDSPTPACRERRDAPVVVLVARGGQAWAGRPGRHRLVVVACVPGVWRPPHPAPQPSAVGGGWGGGELAAKEAVAQGDGARQRRPRQSTKEEGRAVLRREAKNPGGWSDDNKAVDGPSVR